MRSWTMKNMGWWSILAFKGEREWLDLLPWRPAELTRWWWWSCVLSGIDDIECGDNESRMSHKIFHMKPNVGFFAVCRLLWLAPNHNQLTYLGWIVLAWMGSCMNRHLSEALVAWRSLFWSSCTQFKVHLDLYMLCFLMNLNMLLKLNLTVFTTKF